VDVYPNGYESEPVKVRARAWNNSSLFIYPLGFGRAQLIYDEQKTNNSHAFIYEKIRRTTKFISKNWFINSFTIHPGKASEFAEKLSISRATLFRQIEYLREKGTLIKYCRYRRTYYYG